MKIKIIEKSTGKKKVEEWSFLPKDWKYQLTSWPSSLEAQEALGHKAEFFKTWLALLSILWVIRLTIF